MKNKIILVLIISLAFVLRFWHLNTYPALNADEAALGYNAWSLLETGKDEHGNSWPVHFQSFNDYKPGLLVYIVMPFVKILGLTELAVRIPGALAGVGTVLVVYFLVSETTRNGSFVTDNVKKFANSRSPLTAAELSALFLAISPWHIHFSRGGWEVNVATFFITLGLLLFLRALRNPSSKSFSLSVFSFSLSLYTYHAARIVVPLLGLGFLIFYWKDLLKNIKPVVISLLLGLILLIPLVKDLTGPAGISRAAGVGIFSDPGPLNEINEQRGEHPDLSSFSAKVFHNKPVNYSLAFLENYMEHFSGEFLFLSGDEIQRNRVPEHGQMYMIDVLFVIIGLFIFTKLENGRIIGWWLIVSPVAAALTFQSPHSLRAQNMVVPITIISAFGVWHLMKWFGETFLKTKLFVSVFQLSVFSVIAWSFLRYQHLYWVQMSRSYPFSSQYGVKDLVEYVKSVQDNYETVIITDRYDQPYILTLFYLKYPPSLFQSDHELTARDGFGFSTVRSFGKYRFTSITWPSIPNQYPNSLIAGTKEEIPDATNIIKTIEFPSGEKAFQIVAN